MLKNKAAGRRSLTRSSPIARGKRLCQVLDCSFSKTDFEKGTDNGPNHSVQETICYNFEQPVPATILSQPLGGGYVTHTIDGFRLYAAERAEFMSAMQGTGSFVHALEIRLGTDEPTRMRVKRSGARRNVVPICARIGIVACVERVMHRLRVEYSDGSG